MDALLLAAVAAELRARAVGARLVRVVQSTASEVVLHLHAPGERMQLLCSADGPHARIHLTSARAPAPPTPPAFCQALRRHLDGAHLVDAVQAPGLERALHLELAARDELGTPTRRRLVVELVPPRPNLLLLAADGRILDCLRRIPSRGALPGKPYAPPPPQPGRIDPLAADAEARLHRLWAGATGSLAGVLAATVAGLSPASAERLAGGAEAPFDAQRAAEAVRRLAADLAAGELARYIGSGSPSAICEAHQGRRAEADRLRAERNRLLQALRAHRARAERKRQRQEEELARAADADAHRRCGELLLGRLPAIPPGAASVVLENFEDPARLVQVPVDPRLTAAQNAQVHFRRYQKARRAQREIAGQLQATAAEAAHLDDLSVAVQTAEDPEHLQALADELGEAGYLRTRSQPRQRGGRRRAAPGGTLAFATDDGLQVLVGGSALGNDRLTMHIAAPGDIWLHAKRMPGAHVVLRLPPGQVEPPERSLRQAAALAARYSAGRADARVAVDYTRRRHVRKPRGARPGFVLYDGERTLLAAPGEAAGLAPARQGQEDRADAGR